MWLCDCGAGATARPRRESETMKVLVTGGAGFIGSHLCGRLVQRGDDVVIVDDFSSGRREAIAALDGRAQIIDDSVLNLDEHRDALAGVTKIFHLAALISGQESLIDPEPYLDVNVSGVLRVIELARELPRARVVFASSSGVYGNQPDSTWDENAPPHPLTVYALTKHAGEQALAMYGALHGFEHVSLRLFNVYGPGQSPDHPYANVACKFAEAVVSGQPTPLYGDGSQSRDFVYVDDVVDALLLVEDASRHPIYNVAYGADTSLNELRREIERVGGRPLTIEQCNAWPNDIQRIRGDISRLTDEFGFRPKVSLAEGLARTVSHFESSATDAR
jgi:UDP-glucose 4-epimerase